MSRSAYPTASDVITGLQAAGLLTTDYPYISSLAAGAAEAGKDIIERTCNRRFLAGSSEARYFDPPTSGRTLFLDYEATAISSVTLGGSTLTLNSNYWLLPYNYSAEGVPINRIDFAAYFFTPILAGNRRSIVVTGTWGYGATIPESVWQAMVLQAQLQLLPAIREAQNTGAEDWREADVAEKFGTESSSAFLKRMAELSMNNIRGWRRPIIV